MTIARIYKLVATEGNQENLAGFLNDLAEDIRNIPGCLSYEVFNSHGETPHLIVIEKWESIEAHQSSSKHFPKEKMQSNASLFTGPPQGGYYSS